MSEILTLVFGAEGALSAASHVFEASSSSHARADNDRLLGAGSSRVAQAVVLSRNLPSHHAIDVEIPGTEVIEESWSGEVRTYLRKGVPSRLKGSWWHPARSWVRMDEEAFLEHVRVFTEASDAFGGAHIFMDSDMHKPTASVLDALRDEVIGHALTNRSIAFAFDNDDQMLSPSSVVALAEIGQRASCYIPLRNAPLDTINKNVGPALDLISWPYRRRNGSLPMSEFLYPLSSASLPLLVCSLGPRSVGLPLGQLEECHSAVRAFPVSKRDKLNPPFEALSSVVEIALDDIGDVTCNEAILALNEPCGKWIESAASQAGSRAVINYFRAQNMEDDERVDMRDALGSAADTLRSLFD